jgi:thiol-disulfide isomerase/thioredoxin
VVFVDYWATWCEPCVEYFPHTVEMHRKYKDQGLATIGVSFDEPDEEQTARQFLAEQGADFEHLLNSYGVGTEATEKFNLDQVPHFRLYNRQGELVKKWDEKPTDADKLIEGLLAEEAAAPSAESSTPAPSEAAGKTEE